MHYKFPEIRHIEDVLPHIEGREEFIVAERDFGTVINYVVAMADTFGSPHIGVKMVPGSKPYFKYDYGDLIRRECRGLIFDKEGKIMSRPFHKFFNVNERAETQTHEIDLSQPHVVMEKMDGSMIRPILVDGYLRLATKMGVTEVSMQAEEWLVRQDPTLKEWLRDVVENGYTPLFEWVSPFNQIVLAYEESDLVYLGSRNNVTGGYFFDESAPFTKVPQYGSVEGNITDYIARQSKAERREGDIIRFAGGHMLKIKNDWYVRIHKALDRVRFDRNIVALILHEEMDDVVPLMPADVVRRVRQFEIDFWNAFSTKQNRLYGLRIAASQSYGDDRKRIALEFIPTLERKEDAQFIFRMLDGHDLRELLLDHIEKNIGSNTKWDACAEWLGIG